MIQVDTVAVTAMDRRRVIVIGTDVRMRVRERQQQDAGVQEQAKNGDQGAHGGRVYSAPAREYRGSVVSELLQTNVPERHLPAMGLHTYIPG